MTKQIVIYVPCWNWDQASEEEIRRRFPGARFTSTWEEGAIPWQTALKK